MAASLENILFSSRPAWFSPLDLFSFLTTTANVAGFFCTPSLSCSSLPMIQVTLENLSLDSIVAFHVSLFVGILRARYFWRAGRCQVCIFFFLPTMHRVFVSGGSHTQQTVFRLALLPPPKGAPVLNGVVCSRSQDLRSLVPVTLTLFNSLLPQAESRFVNTGPRTLFIRSLLSLSDASPTECLFFPFR